MTAPPIPVTTALFLKQCASMHLCRYGLIAALEAGQAACNMLTPYAIGKLVLALHALSVASEPGIANVRHALLIMLGTIAGELLCSRLSGACFVHLLPLQRQGVARRLFSVLQGYCPQYFRLHPSGTIAQRITGTSVGVDQIAGSILFDFWPTAIAMSVAVLILFNAQPGLGASVLAWTLGYAVLSAWLAWRSHPHAIRASAARSDTAGLLVDSLSNQATVHLFSGASLEMQQLDRALGTELAAIRKANRHFEQIRWFQLGATLLLVAGTTTYAVQLVQRGSLDLAQFVTIAGLGLAIINHAHNLSQRYIDLFEYLGNVAHGLQTLQPLSSSGTPARPCATETRPAPCTVSFELSALSFAYPGGPCVLADVGLKIASGERIGIVGPSGAGKSTLVGLLLRTHEALGGSIALNGQDVTTIDRAALRNLISVMSQETQLFNRSVLDNIRYGRPAATDAEVLDASRRASAHRFIMALPDGYETVLGEKGVSLSGGQKQRIALARALLKDAPVLILDEATSNLDPHTESCILHALKSLPRTTTLLVIAHRASTVEWLDRNVLLSAGRVADTGTHRELLERCAAYRTLWSGHGSVGRQTDAASADQTTMHSLH